MQLDDALADTLGLVVANVRREWERDLSVARAQAGELAAEYRVRELEMAAKIDVLSRSFEERVASVLAGVRNGEVGPVGADGATGATGETGPQGEPGLQGEPGPAGADGLPGRDGQDGQPGPVGEIGEAGPEGSAGPQGEPGIPGADGFPGKDGSPGPSGEIGPAGLEGPQGEIGPQGPEGRQGERGTDGAVGERGTDGEIGAEGPQGPPGERGTDGIDGMVGERGPVGPPGQFRVPMEWKGEGAVHYEGDLVFRRGSTYCARRDTSQEPPGDHWGAVAVAGRDAPVAEHRGLWEAEGQYRSLDLVTFSGSEWRARRDSPEGEPGVSPDWAISGGKGKRGEKGLPGDDGPVGPPGVGVSALDVQGSALILTLSDGRTLAADLAHLVTREAARA